MSSHPQQNVHACWFENHAMQGDASVKSEGERSTRVQSLAFGFGFVRVQHSHSFHLRILVRLRVGFEYCERGSKMSWDSTTEASAMRKGVG